MIAGWQFSTGNRGDFMSYVDSNLMPNETVISRGMIHWSIYIPGALIVLFGLLVAFVSFAGGAFFLVVGGIILLLAWLRASSTELAVTNKRVIAKVGFIRRNTLELLHNKVESMRVDQSPLGRMLDFGTIVIHGTGATNQLIPRIAAPMDFRRAALTAIEEKPAAA
jgi:uncharacterized membrane protein YdbT with pleckstrin-like domain